MHFTNRQLGILKFIQRFRDTRGISPTLEEIATHFGVTKITIYEHLNQLERKGALKREKFRARAIELLVSPGAGSSADCLPLEGDLSLGLPVEQPQEEQSLCLSALFPTDKPLFALRVRDDSLAGEHIAGGDYLIVERTTRPQDGDTVVVVLNQRAACVKRYFAEGDSGLVRLQSPKGNGDPVFVNDPEIRGVVLGVVRRLMPLAGRARAGAKG